MTFLLGQADDEEKHGLVTAFASRQRRAAFRNPLNGPAPKTIEVETPELSTTFCSTAGCFIRLSAAESGAARLLSIERLRVPRSVAGCHGTVHAAPHLARDHIPRAAARQFVGDVQHCGTKSGAGVRTRISDDLLGSPFYCALRPHHSRRRDSRSKPVLFEAKLVEVQRRKARFRLLPTRRIRCLNIVVGVARAAAGPHGLPLIGGGDWNDGLNRIGLGGKGESVWLAWFEICAL